MKTTSYRTLLILSIFASPLFGQEKGTNTGPNPDRETMGPINVLSSTEGRTFANRLAPHDAIYFLIGGEAPEAKFQFSFKYRLVEIDWKRLENWNSSLNLAYTQTSLWDINAASSPFYDTSYMPEVFFESVSRKPVRLFGSLYFSGYQAGYKHESNGKDGPESRSLNYLFVRPVFSVGLPRDWSLVFIPEFFGYVLDLNDNPDIDEYRKYLQLRGAISRKGGVSLSYLVRAGEDLRKITYQLDLTYPLEIKLLDLGIFLQMQYFNGYGDGLLTYDQRFETLRFGLALVR